MGVLKILDHNLQSLVDVQFTLRHGGYQYGVKFDLNQRLYLRVLNGVCELQRDRKKYNNVVMYICNK